MPADTGGGQALGSGLGWAEVARSPGLRSPCLQPLLCFVRTQPGSSPQNVAEWTGLPKTEAPGKAVTPTERPEGPHL